MTDLAIVITAHKKSSRVPNKMLRPFGDSCLFDICLDKLVGLDVPVYICAHEEEFLLRAEQRGLEQIRRTRESAEGESGPVILAFLHEVKHEWLLSANACCPFLSRATIERGLNVMKLRAGTPDFAGVHTVGTFRGWVWDHMGRILNEDPEVNNSKLMKPFFLQSSGLYGFCRGYLLGEGAMSCYWPFLPGQPELIELKDEMEAFDINTMADFRLAELMWRGRREERD